jgi:hypothetical protein
VGPLEPIKQVEPLQALDPMQLPAVWISTAESWKAVATGYAALPEKQIDPKAVRSVIQGARHRFGLPSPL